MKYTILKSNSPFWRKLFIQILVGFLISMVLFVFIIDRQERSELSKKGVMTTAFITKKGRAKSIFQTKYYYEYSVNAEVYKDTYDSEFEISDTIKVFYLPSNPKINRLEISFK